MTDIRTFWKQIAERKAITKEDIAALCLLKALKKEAPDLAKTYLNKSFRPITNTVKLSNGMYPRYALWQALYNVQTSKTFQQLVDVEKENLKALAASLRGSYGEVKL